VIIRKLTDLLPSLEYLSSPRIVYQRLPQARPFSKHAQFMDSVPLSTLAASLGALQIGVFVSHVLFGVTTTQTYIYYSRFPEDPPQLKALVCARPGVKTVAHYCS
jgi:hypothetical protein